MEAVHGFIDRARVVLTAAVTWITLATTVLTGVAAAVVPNLPDPWGSQVAGWVAAAVAFLTGVVNIIRRVTPVPREERGVLPPPPPPS
jgi:hypothetical protein